MVMGGGILAFNFHDIRIKLYMDSGCDSFFSFEFREQLYFGRNSRREPLKVMMGFTIYLPVL